MTIRDLFNLYPETKQKIVVVEKTIIQKRSALFEFARVLIVLCIVSAITYGVTRANDESPVSEPQTQEVSEPVPDTEEQEQTPIEEPAQDPVEPIETDQDTSSSDDTSSSTEQETNTETSSSTDQSSEDSPSLLDTITDTIGTVLDVVSDIFDPTTLLTPEEPSPTSSSTAPILFDEQETDTGKLVTISSPEEDPNNPHTNVLASTTIPEIYKVGEEDKIQIKWKNNDGQEMPFTTYDTDNNGKLDYVEWTIPHLSTQIFEIIFISKAFQLDSNLNIISDIYDNVRTLDGTFSTVSNDEYVRTTFEKTLDNTKDITVYAQAVDIDGPVSIEIYPVYVDGEGNHTQGSRIATIQNIAELKTYKTLLTDLQTPTDMFDLKIIGNVEIDYIVDPTNFEAVQNGPIDDGATFNNTSPGVAGIDYPDPAGGDSVDLVGNSVTATGPVNLENLTDSFGGGSLDISSDLTVTNTITDIPIYVLGTGITVDADFNATQAMAGSIITLNTGSDATIAGDITMDINVDGITINSGATLNDITGTTTISTGAWGITNSGTIANISGAIIGNAGGSIVNNSGATITNISGTLEYNTSGPMIQNSGTITDVSGVVNNNMDGWFIQNSGIITDISGTVTNSGTGYGIYNSYGIINDISGTINHSGTGVGIWNESATTTNISGTINNSGTGFGIYAEASSVITNIFGTINNSGTGAGIWNENATITNISGTINNSGTGFGISNSDTIINISGTVTNSGGGIGIYNYGSINDISATIENTSGTAIRNEGSSVVISNMGGTINNTGTGNGIYIDGGSIANIVGTINNESTGVGIKILGGMIDVQSDAVFTNSGGTIDIQFDQAGSGTFSTMNNSSVDVDLAGQGVYQTSFFWTVNSLSDSVGGGFLELGGNGIQIEESIVDVPLIVNNTGVYIYGDIEFNLPSGANYPAAITINPSSELTDYQGTLTKTGYNGIYNQGTLSNMSGDIIDYDTSAGNSGGAAIYNDGGTIVDVSGTITGYVNTAYGIYNSNSGIITDLSGVFIYDNYGSIIYNVGGSITSLSGYFSNSPNALNDMIINEVNGLITNISGIVDNHVSGYYGINNRGTIDLISGYILSHYTSGITNTGTITELSGYNINAYELPIGLENTLISGYVMDLDTDIPFIWTNASGDEDWDNGLNWLSESIPDKFTMPVLLMGNMTLGENISNPIYFGLRTSTLSGNGYVVDNDIVGINGTPEIGINPAVAGAYINLNNVDVTGSITAGIGGAGDVGASANGGGVTITKDGNLNLASKIINGGVSGMGGSGDGINGYLTLTYDSLTTDTSTYLYDIGTLTINGSTYTDLSGNSTTCTNGVAVGVGCVWNGLFNPLIFYYNNATGDGDWNNVLNWWNDVDFTVAASTLPTALNQVFIHGVISQNTGDPALADTITFNGTSTSAIDITVAQNAMFNDESANSGTITLPGSATFNDSSSNTGTISAATSTFYENLTSTVGGTIVGFLQRIFTTSAVSLRDFTTEGGRDDWTIISTGVNTIVDLSSAIYNLATNVFKGLLGGRFVENETNLSEISGTTWTQVNSENKTWYDITSSSDGTKLAAVVLGGQIYTSTDSGTTWTARDSNRNWVSITSSSDGSKLAAVEIYGKIYTSIDSGATWTARESDRDWIAITSSSDGSKLAAAVRDGQIYTSTDSGATWTARESNRSWIAIASSGDGTQLIAADNGGYLYTSADSGATWTVRTGGGQRYWSSVALSSSGNLYVGVVENAGRIYTSISGSIWLARTAAGSNNWQDITVSSDGTKLAAVVQSGQIYTSVNSGLSWTTQDSKRNWIAITTSSDGSKLAAAVYNGGIYTNYVSGFDVVPDVIITSPLSDSIEDTLKWVPDIEWGDTATLCEYSYDNYETMNTLDCSLDGTDLPRPSAGQHTLSIRATDAYENITEKSVTYTYDNTSPTYTMCGADLLDENRTYYLTQDVTGPCTITASSTTLMGNQVSTSTGYTVTGDVVSSGNDIILSNISITGTVDSDGGDITLSSDITVDTEVVSQGGTISATNATLDAELNSAGGNITVTGSTLSDIINSYGGTIAFSTSITTATTTSEGGNITITNSTTTDIVSSGVSSGASAGTIIISRSTVGQLFALGASGSNGGNGGTITVATSTTDFIYSNGGNGTADGGNAGSITITNSIGTNASSTLIFADGGSSTSCGNGGDAGEVSLIDSLYGTISALGGDANETGCPGSGRTSGQSRTPTIQGTYTSPSGGGGSTGGNTGGNTGGSSTGGTLRNLIRNIVQPINFTPIPAFTPLSQTFNPTTIGITQIPDPFIGFNMPGAINLINLPINFLTNISRFLFAPLPDNFTQALNQTPGLGTYLASVGISKEQDIAVLQAHPQPLTSPTTDISTPPGLFIIQSGEQTLTSFATYDATIGGLAQLIKVSPNQLLTIKLIPQSEGEVTAQYLGQQIPFTQGTLFASASIQTPAQGGRYILRSSSSPLPLLIDVLEPVKPIEKEDNIFIKIWKWLTT